VTGHVIAFESGTIYKLQGRFVKVLGLF